MKRKCNIKKIIYTKIKKMEGKCNIKKIIYAKIKVILKNYIRENKKMKILLIKTE